MKKSHQKATRRLEKKSVQSLASNIATVLDEPVEFGDLLDDPRVLALWNRMLERAENALPDNQRKWVDGFSEACDEFERFQARATEADRRLVFSVMEAEDIKNRVERDAAFLVGFELGRRRIPKGEAPR